MSARTVALIAWSTCVLSLVLTGISIVFLALNRSQPDGYVFEYWPALTVGAISASPVGALIASRRPANAVGWIICGVGLVAGLEHFAGQYAIYALLADPSSLPGGLVLAWVAAWLWVPGAGLLVFLLLLFPDGRLPSRRWLWFGWLSVVVLAAGTLSWAFLPGPVDGLGPIQNPLGIEGAGAFLRPLASGSAALAEGLLALVAALALFIRLRSSRGVERQQIKWFAYVMTMVAASFFLTYTVAEAINVRWVWWIGSGLVMGSILCLPLSIGIAILRHQLYDIDLLINRTLVYGALTIFLASVYVCSVVLLQRVFVVLTGQESQLTIVASTLAIAALFNPVRRRVQGFVDRIFYRRKYDAAKTLEAFSSRLRSETDLGALSGELVSAVRDTVQPEHVSLWLRERR
ncbi:MAG: hypothetical protein ACRDTR_11800 [Rubrobacter sp.]